MAASGVAIAVQAPMNAALGRAIGSPMGAAAVSFGIGFVILIGLTIMLGDSASLAKLREVPLWLLLGGALGAAYVFSALWSVPILGVLTAMSMLILGQMVAALVLDYIGAFGVPQKEISPARILAAALVAAGVVLSRY